MLNIFDCFGHESILCDFTGTGEESLGKMSS